MKFYSLQIDSIICRDLISYIYTTRNNLPYLECKYESVDGKQLHDILSTRGIVMKKQRRASNILENILSAIHAGNPVIIWIDCFYESIRPDTFSKLHWDHTLLIYGYDVDEKVFNIIEHDHRNSVTYKHKQISFHDVENSYNGYVTHFLPKDADLVSFYEFERAEHSVKIEAEMDFEYKFLKNIKLHKKLILQGLKNYQLYSQHLDNLDFS